MYGLSGMTTDCPELRSLLSAVGEKIDATQGKLDSQEIGNALYGLQALNSDMPESKCTTHTTIHTFFLLKPLIDLYHTRTPM